MRWHLVSLCVAILLGAVPSFGLDIVKDGKAVAAIVTPEKPDAVSAEAARLLKQYVKECTGADLAVVAESAAPAGAKIFVGPTKAAEKAGLKTANLVGDSYFMKVKDGALYLVGRDETNWGQVRGPEGAKGTMRAALGFLRDYAGVRWILPCPKGTWTPQQKNLSAPDDLNITQIPNLLYATRQIEPRFDSAAFYPWSLANGARRAIRLFTEGGHTWSLAFPNLENLRTLSDPKERGARMDAAIMQFAKSNPEVFALAGGRRLNQPGDYGGEHNLELEYGPYLCTSHPDFVPRMTKWIQDKFDQGYDLVQLGHSDAMPPNHMCHCDACNAEFGFLPDPADPAEAQKLKATHAEAIGNRILIPHRKVIENCLKSHPNKFVMQTVYQITDRYLLAEKDFGMRFPPNTIAECSNVAPDQLDLLKRSFPEERTAYGRWWGVTLYTYWWSSFGGDLSPKHTPDSIAAQSQKALKYRVFGNYFCGGGENFPAEGPCYYVCLRTLEQPNLKPQELLKEYCDGLYGKAAPTMVAYYGGLEENLKVNPRNGMSGADNYSSDSEKRQRMKFLTCWPAEKLAQLDALLKKAAEEAAGDERALNFIRLARLGYEQVYYTDMPFQEYDAYEKNPTPEGAKKVQAALDARQAWLKRVSELKDTAPEFVRDYSPFPDIFVYPFYQTGQVSDTWLGKPFASGWQRDK